MTLILIFGWWSGVEGFLTTLAEWGSQEARNGAEPVARPQAGEGLAPHSGALPAHTRGLAGVGGWGRVGGVCFRRLARLMGLSSSFKRKPSGERRGMPTLGGHEGGLTRSKPWVTGWVALAAGGGEP